MTDWRCRRCRAQVAPGAPRCPQCPSTEFDKPEPEDEMLKIARDGSVSDSAEVPFFDRLADVRAALAGANAEPPAEAADAPEPVLAEAPAAVDDDAPAVDADADAVPPPAPVPPRVPPRRTPPPDAADG